MSAAILVVEDHAPTRGYLEEQLARAGYEVVSAENGRSALAALDKRDVDLILSDYRMEPVNGLELLRSVRRTLAVPFVLYSCGADARAVFEAGKGGAVRFLEYPFRIEDQLLPVLRAALAPAERRAEPSRGADRLVGSSAAMRRVRGAIRRVAPSSAPVLIHGETGTGKEVAAHAIHEESGRKEFVPVAVPELSEGLLESELFGHERGAFTGAVASRKGLFERANGGTLFLDEIGDTPLPAQVKLLRVLETREVRPVGGGAPRQVDVRIIAATHRDLAEQVRRGAFREDLYYRIRSATIALPSLRDRVGDLEELARVLLTDIARRAGTVVPNAEPSFWAVLKACAWKGNVRELRSVLENAVLWLEGNGALDRTHAIEALLAMNPGVSSDEQLLAQRLLEAYRRNHWNQEAARRELGLTRGEWRSRLARLGLDMVRRRRRDP